MQISFFNWNRYPQKNFHVLIDFLKEIPEFTFVLAGSLHNTYAKEMMERINQENLQERFILPGKINEEEKYWLHANCDAFVFPSLAEGFGLPVVESMSFGKPLFLSSRTSLPEIGGDDAYYFEHFNPGHMKDIFIKGMMDFKKHPTKSQRLIERSKTFSWENAAKAYLKLYGDVA